MEFTTHIVWFLIVGTLLASTATFSQLLSKVWISPAQLQLCFGFLLGPMFLDVIELDWEHNSKLLEVVTEVAVIISLYSAGVKTGLPLLSGKWIPAVQLATAGMLATIVLTVLLGACLLGLSLAASLLLASVLAPTDPVLADELQLRHEEDDHPLRRTLTGEAGFNDGAAFPFVLLAVGLADNSLHPLGYAYLKWIQ